jgi:hypothetical protein
MSHLISFRTAKYPATRITSETGAAARVRYLCSRLIRSASERRRNEITSTLPTCTRKYTCTEKPTKKNCFRKTFNSSSTEVNLREIAYIVELSVSEQKKSVQCASSRIDVYNESSPLKCRRRLESLVSFHGSVMAENARTLVVKVHPLYSSVRANLLPDSPTKFSKDVVRKNAINDFGNADHSAPPHKLSSQQI